MNSLIRRPAASAMTTESAQAMIFAYPRPPTMVMSPQFRAEEHQKAARHAMISTPAPRMTSALPQIMAISPSAGGPQQAVAHVMTTTLAQMVMFACWEQVIIMVMMPFASQVNQLTAFPVMITTLTLSMMCARRVISAHSARVSLWRLHQ
jgi:uncharacterized protein YhhL (DUF1145 family)